MARKITDLDGQITPQDSDYIYSQIKDDDGSGNGTQMNVKAFGDIFQFFQRLMDKGGITPNSLPDNSYSGWQLMDALDAILAPIRSSIAGTEDVWHTVGAASQPAFQNSWTSSTSVRYRKVLNTVHVMGRAQNAGSIITPVFTLPVGYRPSAEVSLFSQEVGAVDNFRAGEVATSGDVTIASASGATNKNLIFYVVFTIL